MRMKRFCFTFLKRSLLKNDSKPEKDQFRRSAYKLYEKSPLEKTTLEVFLTEKVQRCSWQDLQLYIINSLSRLTINLNGK